MHVVKWNIVGINLESIHNIQVATVAHMYMHHELAQWSNTTVA